MGRALTLIFHLPWWAYVAIGVAVLWLGERGYNQAIATEIASGVPHLAEAGQGGFAAAHSRLSAWLVAGLAFLAAFVRGLLPAVGAVAQTSGPAADPDPTATATPARCSDRAFYVKVLLAMVVVGAACYDPSLLQRAVPVGPFFALLAIGYTLSRIVQRGHDRVARARAIRRVARATGPHRRPPPL